MEDLLFVTGYRSDPHDWHKGAGLSSFEPQKEQLGIISPPKFYDFNTLLYLVDTSRKDSYSKLLYELNGLNTTCEYK